MVARIGLLLLVCSQGQCGCMGTQASGAPLREHILSTNASHYLNRPVSLTSNQKLKILFLYHTKNHTHYIKQCVLPQGTIAQSARFWMPGLEGN